jgi:DNA primase large subunit
MKTFDLKIRFENFLEVAPDFHAEEWKLINRYVDRGWTLIRQRELNRLISGKFKQIVLFGKLDIPRLPARLAEAVQRIETEIKGEIRQVTPLKIDGQVNAAFPPCMQKMYDDSISGQVNLSHDARFALAAFLLRVGMSEDDVNKVFGHSPDKDNRLIEYQVDHIASKRSMSSEEQGYFPTGCKKLQTNNLCPVYSGETFDPLCEYIINPLSFYNTRAWEVSKNITNHSWYAQKKDKKQFF